jgi:hypothetical protein
MHKFYNWPMLRIAINVHFELQNLEFPGFHQVGGLH